MAGIALDKKNNQPTAATLKIPANIFPAIHNSQSCKQTCVPPLAVTITITETPTLTSDTAFVGFVNDAARSLHQA